MTKERADYMVRLIASGMGYEFDNEHYFEYLGT